MAEKKLGSDSALSLLASSGTSIPNLVLAGAAATIIAAVFIYKECKTAEEKKYREEIEKINVLYDEELKKIVVPYYGYIEGLPPIFQLNKDNKYESLYYTPAEVRDIGRVISGGTDVALDGYKESIRAALRKLKEYYYVRSKNGDNADITIRVISYLLHMVDTKCLNFLGYEYDIAYLKAISEFINGYASLGRGEHSQHFDYLKDVYSNLLEAQQKLEKHKEFLSLDETVSSLKNHCIMHSDLLIRNLVQMIVSPQHAVFAETVNHDEIIAGILRNHRIHSAILGIELSSDRKIEIPNSLFTTWLKNLSTYYLSSLNIAVNQEKPFVPPYDDFFNFIAQAKDYLENKTSTSSKKEIKVSSNVFLNFITRAKDFFKNNTSTSKKEIKASNEEMEQRLKEIASIFQNSENFIGTYYKESDKKFHRVKDETQLVERSTSIARFAKLTDDVISLQYICSYISKSIKQVGEIYANDPHHFNEIFKGVNQLCTLIQSDIHACIEDFTAIKEKNKNKMQIAQKEQFPLEVRKLLDSVAEGVERLGTEIKKCRKKAKKSINKKTIQSVVYELFEVVKTILGRYFNLDFLNKSNEDTTTQESSTASNLNKNSSYSLISSSVKPAAEVVEQAKESKNQTEESNGLLSAQERLGQLKKTANEIYRLLVIISKNEPQHSKVYFNLYDALIVMQEKASRLTNESGRSGQRVLKAETTLELTEILAQKMLDFLRKPLTERNNLSSSLAREVHNLLDKQENRDVIDMHFNDISRFFYTNLNPFGWFNTDTRKKLAQVEAACNNLSSVQSSFTPGHS